MPAKQLHIKGTLADSPRHAKYQKIQYWKLIQTRQGIEKMLALLQMEQR